SRTIRKPERANSSSPATGNSFARCRSTRRWIWFDVESSSYGYETVSFRCRAISTNGAGCLRGDISDCACLLQRSKYQTTAVSITDPTIGIARSIDCHSYAAGKVASGAADALSSQHIQTTQRRICPRRGDGDQNRGSRLDTDIWGGNIEE